MPTDLNAVLVLILFIIPGFVTQSVLGVSVPRQQRDAGQTALEALLFSCINYAVLGWPLLLGLVLYPDFVREHPVWTVILWVVLLLIVPIGWGLLFSSLISRNRLSGFYTRLGLRYQVSIPRAWDYHFGERNQEWVRVTLKGGTMIAGFMGTRSFASSFPAREDLYLESVYSTDEVGILLESLTNSAGVWISGDEISFIEFISLSGEEANGD